MRQVRYRYGISLLALSALTVTLTLTLMNIGGASLRAQQPAQKSAQQPPATPPPQQGQPAPGTPSAQTPPPSGQQPPAGMPPGRPGPPDEHWKPTKLTNLKVLPKETTPDQIMEIMQHFRHSLGVGCLGCHKGQQGQPMSTFDFADDSKENKEIARAMIKLTDDINTKYPEAFVLREEADKDKPKVTCATCHRRNRHPETEPPPQPPRPEGAPQGPPGTPRPPAAPPL
jgi:hypothetical protein